MTPAEREEQKLFENEVRRIARELWPEAQYDGARIVDGRERDGVFETEDCLHLLEATVSRSKEKAQEDIKKLTTLARKLQPKATHKAVKCWFITRAEPTADQREVASKHHSLVSALSFAQFQSKLIDAASYLNLRENYPFGSVRDPATGDSKASIDYVPLDLLQAGETKLWAIHEIRDALLAGGCFVLLGDYGAGKSTTLRETYRELRRAYFNQRTSKFPIYINLRDHFGQTNPAEILERHGRNLGFSHPTHLVRAWRAGYVILLIDGFDEVTTLGIQGLWKRLQDSRYRAMQAVRQFVRDQAKEVGLALAGRAHFFDSEKERRTALGLSPRFTELTLNEFSTEQIQSYLKKCGLSGMVPAWMPSRPLLVGYLAASGLLKELLLPDEQSQGADPAIGWNVILDRVCAREAEIEAGIDGPTVRRILERLATVGRTTESGLGPLSSDQVITAFAEICGYQPDEKAMVLLQRLPGLGIDRADEGTRIFLDGEFADVCRAGDVAAFVNDPYGVGVQPFRGAQCGLGPLGVSVAANKLSSTTGTCGKCSAALGKASEDDEVTFLELDLARVTLDAGCPIAAPLQFQGIYIPSIELYEGMKDCSNLRFRDCYFSSIELDPDIKETELPRFQECYFGEVEGRASKRDLPQVVFDDTCVFDKFSESPETTKATGTMELPLGTRVLLTVLKKVYLQSGSGRKEKALHRGLDHHARRLVAPVLRLLQTEGLITPYRRGGLDMTIWVPDRAKTPRVAKIITSPHSSGDPLIAKAGSLS